MKMLTLVRLAPLKVFDHLVPMLMHDALEHMTLVRYAVLPLEHPKFSQVAFGTEADAGSDGLPPLRRLWNQVRLFWLGLRTARRENPDVIYGILFTTNGMMAWIIAKLLRKKSLISLIGTDLNKHLLEYSSRFVLMPALKNVDCITVFDEEAREKLIARGVRTERLFVMPHAIRMEHFTRRTDAPQDIDALFVGMFVPLKEISRLIDAWRLVVDVKPDAKLALVGDGILRDQLENQVRVLGITENVMFTGWVDDVISYLSRAKIFVNLSNQEGVPHAMIEAMACGLVPVVTAVGGVPSVIHDGQNGFLVENPADPEIVANRILRLLDDPTCFAAMCDHALKVREEHSYEGIRDAWTPVFDYLNSLLK